MITIDAVLRDRYGLHPRAAMRIRQVGGAYESHITIASAERGGAVDASSLIALVSAGIGHNERIRVTADGPDEAEAAEAIRKLAEDGVCHR